MIAKGVIYHGSDNGKRSHGRLPQEGLRQGLQRAWTVYDDGHHHACKENDPGEEIAFEVSVDPFYSDENMARLRKSIAQMEAIGGTVHEVKLDD